MSRALADGAGASEQNAGAWQHALRAADRRVARSEAGPIGTLDLLIALAEQKEAPSAEVLRLHRVDAWALKWHAAHGAEEVAQPGPAGRISRLGCRLFASRSVPQRADDDAARRVILDNDNFTTKEFVVELLERTFGMPREAAEQKTHEVHTCGSTCIGEFAPDEAERLTAEASRLARMQDFPLRSAS